MNGELLTLLDRVSETYGKLRVKRALVARDDAKRAQGFRRATGISAESIVKYILRQRGWTSRWNKGKCTGRQLLSLLEDCREYGRSRLRHEAELLIEEYGSEREDVVERATGHVQLADSQEHRDGGGDEIILRSIASRARSAVSRFFARTKQFLHELITAGALLIKGSEPLTENDIRIVDRMTKRQHEFLEGFEREIEANPPKEISDLSSQVIDVMAETMSADQFIARAELYGNSVWQAGQQVNRGRIAADPTFVLERRYLGNPPTGHCVDCPALAGKWVPVGTLPEIGDTECGGWCHCWFEYQTADGRVVVTPENEARRPYSKPGDTRPKGAGKEIEAKTSEPPPQPPKPSPVPAKEVPKPKPAKSDNYPPARPLPSVEELIEGTGHTPDYYEEA